MTMAPTAMATIAPVDSSCDVESDSELPCDASGNASGGGGDGEGGGGEGGGGEGGDGAQTRSLLSPPGLQQVACLQQLGLGLAHAH